MSEITVYPARRILTMNPSQPEAHAVAVRDGRILAVGELATMRGWGDVACDDRLRDKVLMPGLVEGHSHVMTGNLWRYPYVGFYDRTGPDGRHWPGLKSLDGVVERLQQAEAELTDPDQPLFAWGFDPIYFGNIRMTREHLDRVSRRRLILVLHVSGHLANVNSALLDAAGITADTPVEGIARGADGKPSGELREFAAMFLAFDVIGGSFYRGTEEPESLWNFARVAQQAGVTTVTDLITDLDPATVANYHAVTADPRFPVRLVSAQAGAAVAAEEGVARVLELRAGSTDKLHFGIVKLITDGSIQGFTARLKWPGYYNGAPNGLWVLAPEQIHQLVLAYHRAGLQLHIHTNGDEASEVALDAVEQALAAVPRWDHRHTLQHCQMAPTNQFRRMRQLGMCVNLFANHLYYWGDAHYELTMGPDRACRMDATATAQRYGVPFSIHSDSPVTPIGPLFTAWCAVNRRSARGRVLGTGERLAVRDALHAVTLGAAYTLKLDHLIGSIEVGKMADFAVLEDDPLAVAAEDLKDVRVWGTVLGGQVFQAAA